MFRQGERFLYGAMPLFDSHTYELVDMVPCITDAKSGKCYSQYDLLKIVGLLNGMDKEIAKSQKISKSKNFKLENQEISKPKIKKFQNTKFQAEKWRNFKIQKFQAGTMSTC